MLYRLRHIPTGLYVVNSSNPGVPIDYHNLEDAEKDQAKIVWEYRKFPDHMSFTYEEFEIDEILDEA